MPAVAFKPKRALALAAVTLAAIFSGIAFAEENPDYELDYQRWRQSWLLSLKDDFGQLGFYRKANASVPRKKFGEQRVVFLGDSITQAWDFECFFRGKPYINRGIDGQTTSQMLLRFHQDVIALKPAAVVILAGANDLNGNTGPISIADIESNYKAMDKAARAHGIKVLFASLLPPPHKTTAKSRFNLSRHQPEKVRALNRWLKAYCKRMGLEFVDYAGAMRDEDGFMRPQLAGDGIHPERAGYAIMTPLAQTAIVKVLSPLKLPLGKPKSVPPKLVTNQPPASVRCQRSAPQPFRRGVGGR